MYGGLSSLVRLSLSRPREGLAAFLRFDLSLRDLMEMAALAIALETLIYRGMLFVIDRAVDAQPAAAAGNLMSAMQLQLSAYSDVAPLLTVAIATVALALRWVALFRVGGFFGGTGGPVAALATIVWFDLLWAFLLFGVLAILLVLPPVAVLLMAGGAFWMLWVCLNFIAELHGFQNLAAVFAALVGCYFGITMALAIIF